MVEAIRAHHNPPGNSGNVKNISHLLAIANLLAKQNQFGNSIVPRNTAPLDCGVLEKLALGFEELEILIENTKESLEAAQPNLTTKG